MFDVTERVTFSKIPKWVELVKSEAEEAIVHLIGNQCDLSNHRKVTREEGEEFAIQYGLHAYSETSAFSGFGIDEAFNSLIVNIIESPHLWMKPRKSDTIDLKLAPPMTPYKQKRCGNC